jgi:phosphatidylglycerophosphate synthase
MDTQRKPVRIQRSWLAADERALLVAMAARLPLWVKPDYLTALGVVGALLCAVGYIGSIVSSYFLWFAVAGLAANWFGDSLDGSLARVRGIERPRYGFFVDHASDVFSQILIFLSFGLSPHMRFSTACLLLMSYWIVALFTFIRTIATNVFQISYFGIGPTEIRIGLLAYTLGLIVLGHISVDTRFGPVSAMDGIALVIFVVVLLSYVVMFWAEARRLAVSEVPEGLVGRVVPTTLMVPTGLVIPAGLMASASPMAPADPMAPAYPKAPAPLVARAALMASAGPEASTRFVRAVSLTTTE